MPEAQYFSGYTSLDKKANSGVQKKASGTGFYKDAKGNTYYFKRTGEEKYSSDDKAETIFAGIANKIFPGRFALCDPVVSKDNKVFVRSTCAKGFKEIYKHKGIGSNFYADQVVGKIWGLKKTKRHYVYSSLTEKEKKQLADILAASLLLGEYDCNTQNIGTTANEGLKKIDHGWGFADLCKVKKNGKRKHQIVRLFQFKPPRAKKAGVTRNTPSNHFIDYQDILISENFRNSLQSIIDQIESGAINLNSTIANEIERMKIAYVKSGVDGKVALLDFARHLDLTINETDNKSVAVIEKEIIDNLDDVLKERVKSLKLVKLFLEYPSVTAKKSKLDKDDYVLNYLNRMVSTIKECGYDNQALSDFIPPFGTKVLDKAIKDISVVIKNKKTLTLKEKQKIIDNFDMFKKLYISEKKAKPKVLAINTMIASVRSKKPGMVKKTKTDIKKDFRKTTTSKAKVSAKSAISLKNLLTDITKGHADVSYIMDKEKGSALIKLKHNREPCVKITQKRLLGTNEYTMETTSVEASNIQIDVIAKGIISAGDNRPKIDSGSMTDVLKLLNKLLVLEPNIKPMVNKRILKKASVQELVKFKQVMAEFKMPIPPAKEKLRVKSKKKTSSTK